MNFFRIVKAGDFVMLKTELILEVAKKLKTKKGFEKKETKHKNGIIETEIKILTDEASKQIGREIGEYVSFNFDDLLFFDVYAKDTLFKCLKNSMLAVIKNMGVKIKKVLVVGLGNDKYACDSLGKRVVDKVLVTKPYLDRDLLSKNKASEIYAVSLGVYGTTGLETSQTIKAICDCIKPDIVVAIDSLIASDENGLSKSVQISNTKLLPGGGVGNNRGEVSEKTIGAKVLAVGVPLVANIKNNLIVCPKDVEVKVETLSKIIAKAINFGFCKFSEREYFELVG